jgi:hypothetical protein
VRALIVLAVCGLLAACGNQAGRPLPMVEKSDPTWSLTLDHLDAGGLPE